MGTCACVMIDVGKHRGMYGLLSVIERRKYIEVYNFVGSTVLGLSVGVLLGVNIGDGTGWEDIIFVSMDPGGEPADSIGNLNDTRGRVYLDLTFDKIWGSGLK